LFYQTPQKYTVIETKKTIYYYKIFSSTPRKAKNKVKQKKKPNIFEATLTSVDQEGLI